MSNHKIHLVTFFSASHESYFNQCFKPSFDRFLSDDFSLVIRKESQVSSNDGVYYGENWNKVMQKKVIAVFEFLSSVPDDEIVIYSDVDIIFFGNIRGEIEKALDGATKLALQSDNTEYCAGFFAVRNSRETRAFFESIIDDCYDDDQRALNRQLKKVSFAYQALPESFSSTWRFTGGFWSWKPFRLPKRNSGLLVYHANFAIGKFSKLSLLKSFARSQNERQSRILAYLILYWGCLANLARSIAKGALTHKLKDRTSRLALMLIVRISRNLDFSKDSLRRSLMGQFDRLPTERLSAKEASRCNTKQRIDYVGVPWAPIINYRRLDSLRISIPFKNGVTVCQHIGYRDLFPILENSGIKTLFTPHCDTEGRNLEILPFPIVSPFTLKPNPDKNILYSFVGCNHYQVLNNKGEWVSSRLRSDIFELKKKKRARIVERNNWHFSVNSRSDTEEYIDTLERSRFSICPRGTGPSTVRFWESLQAGAIPILLSDNLFLPVLEGISWRNAIVWLDENKVDELEEIILDISEERENELRSNGLKYFNMFAYPGRLHSIINDWSKGSKCLKEGKFKSL